MAAACTPGNPRGGSPSGPSSGSPAVSESVPPASSHATTTGAQLAVALIGAGAQGRQLAKRLARNDRVQLGPICDPDSDRAGSLARAVGDITGSRPNQVPDLRRVLDDDRIEAVVVATPHHWHALAAVWALEAGKHVYLEKPATHSLTEGPPLLEAWQRSGLVVEVGTQRRSHPGLQEAIADLHSGRIGPVRFARCYSWKRRPSIGPEVAGEWPESLDPELWYGPRPVVRPTRKKFHYDWHWFTDYGNGGLGNNGVHRLDVARWGLGLDGIGDEVLSLAGRIGPSDAGETPNTALTIVSFGERWVAHDLRGMPTKPDARRDPGMRSSDEVVFVGDSASIVVNRTGGRLLDDSGVVARRYGADAADVDPITRHLGGFVDACIAGDPSAVAVGPVEGVGAAAMCHSAAAAHAQAIADGPDAEVAEVRGAVSAMCGSDMDRPLASFLNHVAKQVRREQMVLAPTRGIVGSTVLGAPEDFVYRAGYELPA